MNPITMASMMAGLGGILGMSQKNPAQAAMGYSEQVPGTVTPYYDPYIQAGQRSLGTLENQFNQLIGNPGQMFNQLAGGFQQSPGYQWQYDNAMNAQNNAAAAGGMAGSPMAQQQSATVASQLANQDFYNYLAQVMGLYNTGLSGISGLNTMGYNASDALAGLLAQNLMNQAGLAAASAQFENSQNGGLLGGLTGAVGGLF